MAVEAVIGEPCSADLPKNSEFTGKFLHFRRALLPDTSGKSRIDAVSTRLRDQMR